MGIYIRTYYYILYLGPVCHWCPLWPSISRSRQLHLPAPSLAPELVQRTVVHLEGHQVLLKNEIKPLLSERFRKKYDNFWAVLILVSIWSLKMVGLLESLKRRNAHYRRRSPDRLKVFPHYHNRWRSPDRWKVFPYNRWRSMAVFSTIWRSWAIIWKLGFKFQQPPASDCSKVG